MKAEHVFEHNERLLTRGVRYAAVLDTHTYTGKSSRQSTYSHLDAVRSALQLCDLIRKGRILV